MVLSVVNLQEAYAKALLVDRERAARRPAGRRRARRPRGRCSTPTAPTSARCARRARAALGAAEDPVAELRASGYAERIATERETRQEITR